MFPEAWYFWNMTRTASFNALEPRISIIRAKAEAANSEPYSLCIGAPAWR